MSEQEKRPEEEKNAARTLSLMQDQLDQTPDTRLKLSAMRYAREEDTASGVSNEREEDCPKAIRICASLSILLFIICLIPWMMQEFTRMEPSVLLSLPTKPTELVLNLAAGISLLLMIVFNALKVWFPRQAWIRRMRQQEEEKLSKQKSDTASENIE